MWTRRSAFSRHSLDLVCLTDLQIHLHTDTHIITASSQLCILPSVVIDTFPYSDVPVMKE